MAVGNYFLIIQCKERLAC